MLTVIFDFFLSWSINPVGICSDLCKSIFIKWTQMATVSYKENMTIFRSGDISSLLSLSSHFFMGREID